MSTDQPDQATFLVSASCMLIGFANGMRVISDYFRSQIMTPPAEKKSIWKAIGEYVFKPFQIKTPQPIEDVVKYQTIDDYISSSQS